MSSARALGSSAAISTTVNTNKRRIGRKASSRTHENRHPVRAPRGVRIARSALDLHLESESSGRSHGAEPIAEREAPARIRAQRCDGDTPAARERIQDHRRVLALRPAEKPSAECQYLAV